MIEIRCNHCNKFLFEASEDTQGVIGITCPRCKNQKNPKAKRTIRLPFATPDREKAVARSSRER